MKCSLTYPAGYHGIPGAKVQRKNFVSDLRLTSNLPSFYVYRIWSCMHLLSYLLYSWLIRDPQYHMATGFCPAAWYALLQVFPRCH